MIWLPHLRESLLFLRKMARNTQIRNLRRRGRLLRGMGGPCWGAGRTLINSIDPGTAFRVSFPLSGAQQERRDLFRSPSVQARFSCAPFPDRAEVDVACSNAKRNEFYWFRRRSNNQI